MPLPPTECQDHRGAPKSKGVTCHRGDPSGTPLRVVPGPWGQSRFSQVVFFTSMVHHPLIPTLYACGHSAFGHSEGLGLGGWQGLGGPHPAGSKTKFVRSD